MPCGFFSFRGCGVCHSRMSFAKVALRSQCSTHSVLPYKIGRLQAISHRPKLRNGLILPKSFALWTPILYPAKAGYKKGVYPDPFAKVALRSQCYPLIIPTLLIHLSGVGVMWFLFRVYLSSLFPFLRGLTTYGM